VGSQRHTTAALPQGKGPGTHCIGGWVGPRVSLDGCGKTRPPVGIRSPDRQARSESLCRLSYPGPPLYSTGCPTGYRTCHFFHNSETDEDIATKFEQEYVRCVRNEEECVCSPVQISLQYPH